MHLPAARGPLSASVLRALGSGEDSVPEDLVRRSATADPVTDEDLQLSLWVLYELHYRGFDGVVGDPEWSPGLISLRRRLEDTFEQALRRNAEPVVTEGLRAGGDVPSQLEHVIGSVPGAPLARFVQREATLEQVLELLAQRSVYTLKESDPTSFVLPRLDGPVKAALAELLYDEYGGGRAERLHADLYARGLAACGLDATYGAYVDQTPAHVLAVNNAMSLFGLNRRLRGAALGHLAAFEATSSLPCRRIAAGIERVGLPREIWDYFDEHVEADAVHEQVAMRDICERLVTAEPTLREDVLLGAAVCQQLEAASGSRVLQAWQSGRSALLSSPVAVPA